MPFSAVVGQDDARLALLLGAVDPGIGGVLLTGEKGTAKTTLVRALQAVLPSVSVVVGCRFSCDPAAPSPSCPDGPHAPDARATHRPARLVELPLGATDDRVTGSLDVPRVLAGASTAEAFSPGLLALAHRGVLYVDEVNLLPDHLVDVLLDAAATGRTSVERDGVSVQHDSRFLLVGTMNPEEGELRPQLLDRFGLCVPVVASSDPAVRADAVRARLSYERSPADADREHAANGQVTTSRIAVATSNLPGVDLSDEQLLRITRACSELGLEGLRGDLVTARTAIAHAAWSLRSVVTDEDVREAARLALPHRRPHDPPMTDEQLDDALGPPPPPEDDPTDDHDPGSGSEAPADGPAPQGTSAAPSVGERPRPLSVQGTGTGPVGRRSKSQGAHGRAVGSVPSTRPELLPTVRAMALAGRTEVHASDLRRSRRSGREANLVVLVLDTSGSLAARQRSAAVTTAALSLLDDAYLSRDRIALVTFRGTQATTVVPPTGSVVLASRRLAGLPVGGPTPLAAGLREAATLVQRERWREPGRRPLVVVITDGRATGGADPLGAAHAAADVLRRRGVRSVVVDAESGPVRLRLAEQLARSLGAEHIPMPSLSAASLSDAIRQRRAA